MALGACQYCGRQNDAGAQFCSDCGKPLTKAAAARAAVASGGGGSGGASLVSRTSGPEAGGGAPLDGTCPLRGCVPRRHSTGRGGWGAVGGGGLARDTVRIPDQRPVHSYNQTVLPKLAR